MKWNTVFGHPHSILSFALDFTVKQNICFPKVGWQMHTMTVSTSQHSKVHRSHRSSRKSEIPVPHSAWQVWNLRVEEVGFGSDYTATDLTPGCHRSSNSSKRDSFWFHSSSALPTAGLEHPCVQPAGCGPHSDTVNEQRMKIFYFWTGNQELDSGSKVCQCALSPA